MIKSIFDDAKREFSYGNMVTRLILVNVGVFIFIHIIQIVLFAANGATRSPLYTEFIRFFSMSSDVKHILTHPWVLVTSMFLHEGFWHILWNMLYLYWFGRIVGDFLGNRRVFPLYILGGLFGGLFFYASANLMPGGSEQIRYALGASGGVMAIVVAAGVIAPDYIMRLLFLGDVKLKYIVMALVFLDMIGIANDMNTGGHFAHLGGALMGWLYIYQLRNGTDWGRPVAYITDGISRLFSAERKPKMRVVKTGGVTKSSPKLQTDQERLDQILDKIKQSGYKSLTKEEKEYLFKASQES
jgi:membrane associated rhomboid family serine protease